MTAARDEDEDWEQAGRRNWRGLGLTDPIKSVEVYRIRNGLMLIIDPLKGQMAFVAGVSQSKGSCQTAH